MLFYTIETTLLDRYIIYSEMLLLFEKEYPSGLCAAFSRVAEPERKLCEVASRGRYSIYISYPSLFQLPELFKRKPKNTYSITYWFSPFHNRTRIKILKEAIEDVLEQMDYDLDNY